MRRHTAWAALAVSVMLAAAPVASVAADDGWNGGGEVHRGDLLHQGVPPYQGDPLYRGDPPDQGVPLWMEHAATDDEVAREGRAAMPFTADQIEALGRLLRETQGAASLAADPPPEGRIRRVRMGAPGEGAIPAIAVRKGYVTAVSFTDATGAPWPIEEVLLDDRFVPGTAGPDDEAGGRSEHLFYLAPQTRALYGNAVVKRRGCPEPVGASLRGGGADADFRVEIRLGLPGPNAVPGSATGAGFHAGDAVLLDLLGGIAPQGAERLAIDGGSADDRAWRLDGDLLLVSRAHLLSPGPWAAERGAGGRWAYRLPDVPYALVSRDGRETRLAFRREKNVPAFPELENGGERR
ncbi:MAG: hypothetical protein OXE57_15440 [Alphaproteobacteria bacterium]|nr:hypothetical protein [Alphaproteobacteria bacterium]